MILHNHTLHHAMSGVVSLCQPYFTDTRLPDRYVKDREGGLAQAATNAYMKQYIPPEPFQTTSRCHRNLRSIYIYTCNIIQFDIKA